MHIVARPRRAPRRRISQISVRRAGARPSDAERVAERDRAAVHVQPLVVDPELADAGEHLGREGLVQLDEVDVVDVEAGALERLAAWPGPGPMPMYAGSTPAAPLDTMRASGSRPSSRGALLGRQHHARGAVVDLRRVAGGHRAALAEHRPQPGEASRAWCPAAGPRRRGP